MAYVIRNEVGSLLRDAPFFVNGFICGGAPQGSRKPLVGALRLLGAPNLPGDEWVNEPPGIGVSLTALTEKGPANLKLETEAEPIACLREGKVSQLRLLRRMKVSRPGQAEAAGITAGRPPLPDVRRWGSLIEPILTWRLVLFCLLLLALGAGAAVENQGVGQTTAYPGGDWHRIGPLSTFPPDFLRLLTPTPPPYPPASVADEGAAAELGAE